MGMLFALIVGMILTQFKVFQLPEKAYQWIPAILNWISSQEYFRPAKKGIGLILAFFIPLTLGLLIVLSLMGGYWYGILKLIFLLGVTFYAFNASSIEGDDEAPLEQLSHQYHYVFAPLFYGLLLGPIGFISYFILAKITSVPDNVDEKTSEWLQKIKVIFDFLPARLLSFSLALVGPFKETFQAWNTVSFNPNANLNEILHIPLFSALNVENEESIAPEEFNGLLQRTLYLWAFFVGLMLLGELFF